MRLTNNLDFKESLIFPLCVAGLTGVFPLVVAVEPSYYQLIIHGTGVVVKPFVQFIVVYWQPGGCDWLFTRHWARDSDCRVPNRPHQVSNLRFNGTLLPYKYNFWRLTFLDLRCIYKISRWRKKINVPFGGRGEGDCVSVHPCPWPFFQTFHANRRKLISDYQIIIVPFPPHAFPYRPFFRPLLPFPGPFSWPCFLAPFLDPLSWLLLVVPFLWPLLLAPFIFHYSPLLSLLPPQYAGPFSYSLPPPPPPPSFPPLLSSTCDCWHCH